MSDSIALAINALVARAMLQAAENLEKGIEIESTKVERKKVSYKKAKKEDKPRLIAAFPEAAPIDVETFVSLVNGRVEVTRGIFRAPTPMEKLSYCYGFIAWLKTSDNQSWKALSPNMAPGVLLDSCMRIVYKIKKPSVLASDDLSNRVGKVVQFGSAGTNHKAEKIIGAMKAQLIAVESEALRNEDEYVVKSQLAEELQEVDPATSAKLVEEALTHKGLAAIETARAQELREMIEKNDLSMMIERYDSLGASMAPQQEVLAVDFGS